MSAPTARHLLLPAALAWGTFGLMGWWVHRAGHAPFDDEVLEALHHHARPHFDWLALELTKWGNTGPMLTAGVLLTAGLVWQGRQRPAGLFVAGLGGSMLLTQVIKHLVTRPRPTLWVSLRPEHTYSFPSGHAMDTAALVAALFFVMPPHRCKWWALALLFPLGVGWARMYLGVHFPSDVLAGWSAGAGWVLLVQLLASRGSQLLPAREPAQTSTRPS